MEVNSAIQKIGVVGLGKMGIMHACLLNVLPNVHVEALCDKSRLMRTVAKSVFQGTLVTNRLDALTDLNLDAIYVLTPIPSHYPIIKQIYTKNLAKNVFVEKTLTSKYAHSLELVKMAEALGGVNMVGYMKRFGVTFNKVKELLDKKVLGDLISFKAYAFSSDFVDVPQGSLVSKARGGVVEDLGSHVVDLAVWFFGDLKITYAKVNSRITVGSLDDVSFGVVGADGLEGDFEVSWRKSGYRMPEFGLTINGTKGSLNVNDDQVKLELNGALPSRWYRMDMDDNVDFLLGGPEYWRENKHFTDAVVLGQQCQSNFKCALKVDFMLEQVRCQLHD
ncbi:MAG: Gfo/Idh/MocA family oxidoreductase [Candidatus Bathyarchaeota archaeon]|nr:Gfo/Idh/MocA family oxidoreductase [Candidatus Bathyarchaeota archaeon]